MRISQLYLDLFEYLLDSRVDEGFISPNLKMRILIV